MMQNIFRFLKNESVLAISGGAALISAFLVSPSGAYLSYPDYQVLALLFCLMAVVAGLGKTGVFRVLSQSLLSRTDSIKAVSLILVLMCFFSSMLITNDVALLTFVPLSLSMLSCVDGKRRMFVVIMQTVAANLGSMLTPVGNPQNLYLYSRYGFRLGDFLSVTAPIAGLGLVMILALMSLGKGGAMETQFPEPARITDQKRLACYAVLFVLCLCSVFGALDYRVLLGISVLALVVCDRTLFRRVDYCLLLTFVFFFVFVGNLTALPPVKEFLSGLIGGRELLVSVVLSQGVSNVPAAMMLSGFTENGRALVAGTNIGGLGTLVASLASLISYRLYARSGESGKKGYLAAFSVINFSMLAVLTGFALIFYR